MTVMEAKRRKCITYAAAACPVSSLTQWLICWIILFVCLFVIEEIQYHGSLPSRELGQAPKLHVFLTPRQALSYHLRQQIVWLYWLQDRDSMPNWYNHPTTLHTHNEIQWPSAAHQWQFALGDVSRRLGLNRTEHMSFLTRQNRTPKYARPD